jgi:hypothetical protein
VLHSFKRLNLSNSEDSAFAGSPAATEGAKPASATIYGANHEKDSLLRGVPESNPFGVSTGASCRNDKASA